MPTRSATPVKIKASLVVAVRIVDSRELSEGFARARSEANASSTPCLHEEIHHRSAPVEPVLGDKHATSADPANAEKCSLIERQPGHRREVVQVCSTKESRKIANRRSRCSRGGRRAAPHRRVRCRPWTAAWLRDEHAAVEHPASISSPHRSLSDDPGRYVVFRRVQAEQDKLHWPGGESTPEDPYREFSALLINVEMRYRLLHRGALMRYGAQRYRRHRRCEISLYADPMTAAGDDAPRCAARSTPADARCLLHRGTANTCSSAIGASRWRWRCSISLSPEEFPGAVRVHAAHGRHGARRRRYVAKTWPSITCSASAGADFRVPTDGADPRAPPRHLGSAR